MCGLLALDYHLLLQPQCHQRGTNEQDCLILVRMVDHHRPIPTKFFMLWVRVHSNSHALLDWQEVLTRQSQHLNNVILVTFLSQASV